MVLVCKSRGPWCEVDLIHHGTSVPNLTGMQVRECATALLHVAKRQGVPLFLVGHVTKTGPYSVKLCICIDPQPKLLCSL